MASKPEAYTPETTRTITLSGEVFGKLEKMMKAKGFPKKPVSESQVISEAIEKLYEKEFGKKTKKEG